MHRIPRLTDLPTNPAIYTLHGGKKGNIFVAYVGIGDNLRNRIIQHMVRRDSSITTGTGIITLNPDCITEIRWWNHPRFEKREVLEATEVIGFEVFDPVLRGRAKLSEKARILLSDPRFREDTVSLLQEKHSGSMKFLDYQDLIEKIGELENKIEGIESKVTKRHGKI
jgi:hypothetical protein